ncbi:MAG: PAS domain S-box protein [Ignavibacteriales bacterium]|jgi:PAS domain S-box|nr:MAG: PAS domain S-box protein [Ignavibacteriaceae bacterium]MBW7872125.1 PAS domain S-box protein [Ignavibacteria bacterium]MCZ2143759.1 PAS domain S-box protein [Ignavibacteriales bacterium]MBV6445981.1 Sensor histidine kinase RcsC [Ignavibacteriaceae bacterium]MBZ0197748.1 PAS domain S-box protein [Ignavibacteriaceae bacterium]
MPLINKNFNPTVQHPASVQSVILDLPQIVTAVDENGIFVAWNKIAEVVFGWTAEEIIGNPKASDLLYPDPEYLNDLREYWHESKGQYLNYIWKVTCKNGEVKWISWSNISHDHSVEGWYSWALGTDVTEIKEISEKLEQNEVGLRTITHISEVLLSEPDFDTAIHQVFEILYEISNADRVYIFENDYDPNTDRWYMNQTYEWTKDSIKVQIDNPELQGLCYNDFCPRWKDTMLSKLAINGLVKDFPQIEQDALAPQDIKALLAVPIYLNDEWWGFIGFDNCTKEEIFSERDEVLLRSAAVAIGGAIQREKTNKELRIAKIRAEEMNRLKSNFLSNMSHELRTPLISILGYADILMEELRDLEFIKIASSIKLAGQRLNSSLNLILDLSQIEANALSLNYKMLNVSDLIHEIISNYEIELQEKSLYVEVSIPQNLSLIKTDRKILGGIFENMLSNAIKFTNKGGINVTVTPENDSVSNNINLIVADTGIGIAPELQHTIFEAFRQESEGLSRKFEGIGLGLTIIKKFSEKLGGTVELQSKPGVGTTVTVNLPTFPELTEEAEISEETPDTFSPSWHVSKKIALCESDSSTATMLRIYSRKIAEVESYRLVSDLVLSKNLVKPDLLILDLNVRNIESRQQLLEAIKTTPLLNSVPILSFSTYGVVLNSEKSAEMGFDGFIPKPVTKSEFLRIIKKYI